MQSHPERDSPLQLRRGQVFSLDPCFLELPAPVASLALSDLSLFKDVRGKKVGSSFLQPKPHKRLPRGQVGRGLPGWGDVGHCERETPFHLPPEVLRHAPEAKRVDNRFLGSHSGFRRMSVNLVMPRGEQAEGAGGQRKSQAFVLSTPYMMSGGPIPLDTPGANAHLYLPNAHISGCHTGVKKGTSWPEVVS